MNHPWKLASPAEALRLIAAADVLGLDLETTGLDPLTDRIRLLSVCDGKHTAVVDCFQYPLAPLLLPLDSKTLIAHNAAFDLGFLWRHGLRPARAICTYLLAQVLTAGEFTSGFPPLTLAACCR